MEDEVFIDGNIVLTMLYYGVGISARSVYGKLLAVLLVKAVYHTIDHRSIAVNGTGLHTISGILDVKFDLSNALWGYDPSRRWNSALYAGPVISRHRRIDSSLDALEQSELPEGASVSMNRRVSEDNYWGAHVGFNTRYSLTDRLGLFGELDLRVYDNEYLGSEMTLDFNPVRHIGARVGISFDLK